jgi:hypothetical protein
LAKLNGTKFWPLISAKLKECGFDRTSDQCKSYWYGQLRLRTEFKDTLQFRSVNERSSMPLSMASKTETDTTASGASKFGIRSSSGSFSSIEAGTGTASGSLLNTGAEHAAETATETPKTKSDLSFQSMSRAVIEADHTPSLAMSKSKKENGGMARWAEHETQKLRELVIAKRNSMGEDKKELGVAFWTSISQELENNQIHRSSQACARRFQRTSKLGATEPGLRSDDTPDPMPEKASPYYPKPNNEGTDTDADADDGSKSDLNDGDTPYGEPRRRSRKRVSKGVWTDEEHNRLVQLMKARRQLESEDERLEKLSNYKLYALVSKQLKQYLIDRSAGACNLYWNNKGFARSGFDNSPAISREGNLRKSSTPELSPVGKNIENAFSRLPHQDFDDSPVIQNFRKVRSQPIVLFSIIEHNGKRMMLTG